MRPSFFKAVLACFALAAALTGCGGRADSVFKQLVGYQCGESAGNPLCSTGPAGEGAAKVSRYCYATIGDANCLDRPDVERKNQALGSSGY